MEKKEARKFSGLDSIQFIIAISCIAISLIPMTYAGISLYGRFSQTIIKNSQISTEQTMDQLKLNVEDYLEQGIRTDREVDTLISQNNNIVNSELLSKLDMFYSTRNDIVSISIFTIDGELVTTVPGHNIKDDYNIKDEEWFHDIFKKNVMYSISKPHVQNILKNEHQWVLSICKPVYVQKSGINKNAVLVIDVSFQSLNNLCSNLNLGGRGYVYIMGENNNILYHPQQALVFSSLKEELSVDKVDHKSGEIYTNSKGEKFLVVHKNLSFVNWNLVGVSYIDGAASENTKITKEVMATIPIILFIIVLLSWYISGKISMPIMKLERYMKKVQKGNFDTQIVIKNGEREVIELANTFNDMVKKIKELMEEKRLEQEEKRKSELNALQAQINPHFLYNTLDSIMWMAENEQNEEVTEMVTALARLFRISISKGKNIISVEQELEHARNYMLIQKMRYKDKFEFEINADEEVKKLKTVKLILQPLIENSIYHGIEYMVDEGYIEINASILEEHLLFEVKDNGLGMDEDQLKKLRENHTDSSTSKKGNGVGVRNVDERIKLRFGKEYGLEIHSELEEGTIVKLWLPIIRGD